MGSETLEQGLPKPAECDPQKIRAQADRVLESPLFQSSRRCRALLAHLVDRTVAGETATLKERNLGAEVFGRSPDYDTNADPVVRAAAAEIRKKLAQYYQDASRAAELRIELRPGSYVPEFHAGAEHVQTTPADQPGSRRFARVPRRALLAACPVIAVAGLAVLVYAFWPQQALDGFWQPMWDAPEGVLFCVGQPRAYNFRSDAVQREMEKMIEGMAPAALEASKTPILLGQLAPLWDRYMAIGDANCLLRLTALFGHRGKPYRIRGCASTTYSDLRERPAVLIGAFNNEWSLRAISEMRYTFYKDYNGLEMVRDRDRPGNTDWKVMNSWPNWRIAHDYALVSRVFDVKTGGMVVVAAGFTHFGTEGAGEFLTDGKSFVELASRLPADWRRKNLQVVLRVPVVQGASGHPQIVATHVW
jgi:hypothetical protein